MTAIEEPLDPNRKNLPAAVRKALRDQTAAVGDLRVVECALRMAASEGDPIDWETRLVVLNHAADLLHDRLETLDETIDLIEDGLLA